MSTSFTSGPWKAEGYFVRQAGQAGTRMIADVCYTGPHHTPPDEYPKSCALVDEANARLIAASPDLLAALVDCAECLKRLPDVDGAYRATCLNQASAAINLATGQKP